MFNDLRSHVRVKVKTDSNRKIGTRQFADAAKELAFTIFMSLRHHGPVQVQIDAVQDSRAPDAIQDHAGYSLKCIGCDIGGGFS